MLTVKNSFSKEGALAQAIQGFSPRQAQTDMALTVFDTLKNNKTLTPGEWVRHCGGRRGGPGLAQFLRGASRRRPRRRRQTNRHRRPKEGPSIK